MPRWSHTALTLTLTAVAVGCPTMQPKQPPPNELAGPASPPATPTTEAAQPDTPPAPDPAPSREPAAPWSLRYHDGSNNATSFSRASATSDVLFEYDPMTPAKSSSGTYSGGSPRTGVATPDQVASLWERALELEGDADLRADNRSMGTGAFTISTPEGERAFLIHSSKSLAAFDAFLRPLQGR